MIKFLEYLNRHVFVMKISEFLSENFQFLEVKFSIYLNRCVFVMLEGIRKISVLSD